MTKGVKRYRNTYMFYFLYHVKIFDELLDTEIKFSVKGFVSKCDQIRMKLQIWSHLLKKPLMENFSFCAVR